MGRPLSQVPGCRPDAAVAVGREPFPACAVRPRRLPRPCPGARARRAPRRRGMRHRHGGPRRRRGGFRCRPPRARRTGRGRAQLSRAEPQRAPRCARRQAPAGRSRNDQAANDLKLYLRDEARRLGERILDLADALVAQAGQHLGTLAPGFTHLQPAQPIVFAHEVLAHAQTLVRDVDRLRDWDGRHARSPSAPRRSRARRSPCTRSFGGGTRV